MEKERDYLPDGRGREISYLLLKAPDREKRAQVVLFLHGKLCRVLP